MLTETERRQQISIESDPMGNQLPSEHIAPDAPAGNQLPIEPMAVGQSAHGAPLCKGHQEPCVKKRVNKSGPNKGLQPSRYAPTLGLHVMFCCGVITYCIAASMMLQCHSDKQICS